MILILVAVEGNYSYFNINKVISSFSMTCPYFYAKLYYTVFFSNHLSLQ